MADKAVVHGVPHRISDNSAIRPASTVGSRQYTSAAFLFHCWPRWFRGLRGDVGYLKDTGTIGCFLIGSRTGSSK